MRTNWVRQGHSDRLLIAFAGWGVGAEGFDILPAPATDLVVFSGYRDLRDDSLAIARYAEIEVFAYSFGVAAAGHWLAQNDVTPSRFVAVAGTFDPTSETLGIPRERVQKMVETLDDASLGKFYKRAGFVSNSEADIDALKDELAAISERGSAPVCHVDLAWIPLRDRIIPTAAQQLAWRNNAKEIREISGSHYPFNDRQTWAGWLT